MPTLKEKRRTTDERAYRALLSYDPRASHANDQETAAQDMIADLLVFVAVSHGGDVAYVSRLALEHARYELDPANDAEVG
jgi:hypothetical protein